MKRSFSNSRAVQTLRQWDSIAKRRQIALLFFGFPHGNHVNQLLFPIIFYIIFILYNDNCSCINKQIKHVKRKYYPESEEPIRAHERHYPLVSKIPIHFIKNVINGRCNSRVLIGLAAMGYQQLYHAREIATITLFSGCSCKAKLARSSNIS